MPAVEDLVSWHDAIQRNRSLCQENAFLLVVHWLGVVATNYALGLRFDSRLADFRFLFFLCFFPRFAQVLRLGISVVRLGLGIA